MEQNGVWRFDLSDETNIPEPERIMALAQAYCPFDSAYKNQNLDACSASCGNAEDNCEPRALSASNGLAIDRPVDLEIYKDAIVVSAYDKSIAFEQTYCMTMRDERHCGCLINLCDGGSGKDKPCDLSGNDCAFKVTLEECELLDTCIWNSDGNICNAKDCPGANCSPIQLSNGGAILSTPLPNDD
jgi:hypothetical protein